MSAPQLPCIRKDILALVPRYERWTVTDSGDLSCFISHETMPTDLHIETYRCRRCGGSFQSWQAALAHLPKEETRE